MSESAWAANVHSVSKDYPTLSDDEPFTVVKVLSITVEPAVVCVGHSNIAYTITTQPTGFEHMVQYTPADVSTPGVKEVLATCGTSSATCTVTVVRVKIKQPTGDPANPDEADEWNERSYNDAIPGVLTVVCEAEDTPNADKLWWKIEDVGTIKGVWDPSVDEDVYRGKGLSATVTFTGMPAHNADFGRKKITLIYEGLSCFDETYIEVFFDPKARNNPGPSGEIPPDDIAMEDLIE